MKFATNLPIIFINIRNHYWMRCKWNREKKKLLNRNIDQLVTNITLEKIKKSTLKGKMEMLTLESGSECWCPIFSLNFLKVPETHENSIILDLASLLCNIYKRLDLHAYSRIWNLSKRMIIMQKRCVRKYWGDRHRLSMQSEPINQKNDNTIK